jgi:F5/8 type C domain-containing protein
MAGRVKGKKALLARVFTIAGWMCAMGTTLHGQTIRVDATPSHATNTIVPTKALGAGIDRLGYGAADKLFTDGTIQQMLSAGWQTVTYRQNTELHMEAWHWNPQGTWSDPAGKGYFTGNATPGGEMIRHSYGYPLPHRGVTRDDGTDNVGYSRLTDGDTESYWKSNPYLTEAFTGESDSRHPQWVFLDLTAHADVTAIRIAWGEPYARKYAVQYWTGENPIRKPTAGVWQTFPSGAVTGGKGGEVTVQLAQMPVNVRWVRILMTESSNTCDTHGAADKRNCVGYAIRELYLGTATADGKFHDVLRHTADQDQTPTYCSSVDPWHAPEDLDERAGDQVGFDLFYTSGVTRGLPAMIPIALIYGTPEDAVAEIAYITKRGYPISYVEMGEEADGHYMTPEDYATLYVQFAAALHKLDPELKLGGPIFTGVNTDIETWPDADGKTSWTRRFIDYLKSHGKLGELAFFSFEHYPMEPGQIPWSSLYDEAKLVTQIMKVWREDGVPANVPLFITESNISSASSEAYPDIYGGLWLADYIGAFLSGGGDAVYYFHYMPEPLSRGHNGSTGTFSFFAADRDFKIGQPLSQYFASQLINLEWVQPGNGTHKVFAATSDVSDGAGHSLVTAYPVLRPDGQWSLLVINKDQENAQTVGISFDDEEKRSSGSFAGTVNVTTFGKAQYQWHANVKGGTADPDGPALQSTVNASAGTKFTLPAASVTVIRGSVAAGKVGAK